MKQFYAVSALALGVVFACASADAADRTVTVRNKTSQTMTKFYASNTGTDDWEEDILGSGELGEGESIDIDVDDGTGKCKFDFMGVFEDGEKVVKKNVNVCEVGVFNFTE